MQIHIRHGVLNQNMWLTAASILFSNWSNIKNAKIANFVYYGKTQYIWHKNNIAQLYFILGNYIILYYIILYYIILYYIILYYIWSSSS